MREIRFATTNPGKIASVSSLLARHGVSVLPVRIDLPELQVVDLRVIAAGKVLAAYAALDHKPVIAQDAGFSMPDWGGFPGPFVKFALQTLGLDGFLTLAKAKSRRCEFGECLAYFDSSLKEPVLFEGVIPGILADKPRGQLLETHWSELVLLFVPEGETKTIAEMNQVELDAWRRKRGQTSAMKFAEWFAERIK